jgi:hypothetical protein
LLLPQIPSVFSVVAPCRAGRIATLDANKTSETKH